MSVERQVIVVGAGPCGCLLALRLIRLGIRVSLFEQDEEIQPHFRALGYPGATHAALQKAGIWEEAKTKGFIKRAFSWRKLPQNDGPYKNEKQWGDLIATWDPYVNSPLKDGDIGYGMLALPQNRFREIIMPKLLESDLADVYLGHRVVDICQDANSAIVTSVNTAGLETQVKGAFVVGADGGKSVVRRKLGLHLEGFTWPHIVVAVDIRLDLQPPADGPSSIYYVDPTDWAFFSTIEPPDEKLPNLWRCTLAMSEEESRSETFDATLKRKLEKLIPGSLPLEYELLRAQPYRLHQRNTTTMKSGRCLLIGDAAHLTNPWGGLGLTTGILDADSLAEALEYVVIRGRGEEILQAWSDARVDVFKNIVSPTATRNLRRCNEVDPNNPFSDRLFRMIHENSQELVYVNRDYDRMVTDMSQLVN
ncbi:Monooxygenase, FAD-binding [Penicillium occitanis (nom. inval.)]|nr:Monooxygenase, FAD-binding [Penicillium occitanis (nom. inval.)]PCG95528.1 hypothetical protein PENOC_077230 [Penicillium occitanis (nom. inval.)]